MIALLFLAAMIGYLWLIFVLARKGYRFVRARGNGCLLSGAVAVLIGLAVLAPIFWDAIPTWYTHRQLCEAEFGLKVYMTPEEWVKQNPERFAQIQPVPEISAHETRQTPRIETRIEHLNSEFDTVWDREKDYGFGVLRDRYQLVDRKTGQVLAEDVDFAGGVSGGSIATGANSLADYKFWLETHSCGAAYLELRAKFDADNKAAGVIFNTVRGWGKK